MRLIVGLGNPGPQYAETRHNLGFQVVDALAERLAQSGSLLAAAKRQGFDFKPEVEALTTQGVFADADVILAKPQTYMNLSGRSVKKLLYAYGLNTGDLIVIYDDLDLPLGKLRIRERGSSGGHRGVQSIIDELSSEEFLRLRLGIRQDEQIADAAEYVLSPFPPEIRGQVDQMIERAIAALEVIVRFGPAKAMSLYN